MTTDTYNLITTWILIAGFAATLIGLILVVIQLRQNRRTREVEICLTLSQTSMSAEFQEVFDFVWDFDFKKQLEPEQFIKAEKVCVFFELVGTFIVEKYMTTNLIASYYGSLLTGCYDKLYPFIEKQRSKPYNEKYSINFEKAAQLLTLDNRVSVSNPRERKLRKK
jgi:hypothetical protein